MRDPYGQPTTVLLGLGNPQMGDAGLGPAVTQMVRDWWRFEPPVAIVAGGGPDINLRPLTEHAERVLMVDAVDAGYPAGTMIRLEHEDVTRVLSHATSPHRIDLRRALALAELRGGPPATTLLLGMQPAVVHLSADLSRAVRDGLHRLTAEVVVQLDVWGHRPHSARTP